MMAALNCSQTWLQYIKTVTIHITYTIQEFIPQYHQAADPFAIPNKAK